MTDELERLQAWYLSRCDGDWEHDRGVSIGTLDNPGWSLEVLLVGTDLEDRPFERRSLERTPNDWMECWVENSTFHGRGGPENLGEMIAVFLDWTGAPSPNYRLERP